MGGKTLVIENSPIRQNYVYKENKTQTLFIEVCVLLNLG